MNSDERELTIHQDTTFNTTKMSVVLSVGGIMAIAAAGAIYGGMSARLTRVEHDVEVMAPAAEMRQGFNQIDNRLSRIEQLLDARVNLPGRMGP
jgi:hypothetical protein